MVDLSGFSLDELLDELRRRGYEVVEDEDVDLDLDVVPWRAHEVANRAERRRAARGKGRKR